MKTTRTLAFLVVGSVFALASTANADTSSLLSFRDGSLSGVVSTPVASFGYQKIDFTVSPFAGLTFEQSRPTGGLMIGPQFKGWSAGVYGRWVQGKPVDAGLYLGFSWQK